MDDDGWMMDDDGWMMDDDGWMMMGIRYIFYNFKVYNNKVYT